ncbi:MAG TPA: very short patch repair endonuclease [Sphaerochaeta sp.]|jgi:DNA mismatch endonuclease (patch repair protein)|nr:very short patch repair endonuclease [Spirochaetota bacterium]NLV60096.1 DNA mismatch endonuclease Vsr [Spirochaetales bacterium]HOE83881.1 very short patch repair endonuclease [Sphaerochaeta sp.]HOQ93845.1 very short patch repair endonuclease [Sphaerochaeta sp.]HPK46300.1 very short patch repair endonuclease [Sphaerochaeta sp.]
MADCVSSDLRRRIMASIKAKDTRAELLVRRYLHRQGFRYRTNDRRLPGTPDIVLPKYRTVIFINGCFWHAHHGCSRYTLPTSNQEFWREKLAKNRERDQRTTALLLSQGWRVLVVWECELATRRLREETLSGLVNEIYNN